MSLIECPEWQNEVSDSSLKCPNCGVQLRKPKRTFLGKVMKWGFIIFNVVMIAWMASFGEHVTDVSEGASSGAEQAGVAIGAGLGTGLIMMVWLVGDVVLGLFVLFTRPQS